MTPTTIARALFSLAAAALLTAAPAHASPADPTDGGKGGRIVRVTTLAKDGPGMSAYLYERAVVGVRQVGDEPLSIIIAYPVEPQSAD